MLSFIEFWAEVTSDVEIPEFGPEMIKILESFAKYTAISQIQAVGNDVISTLDNMGQIYTDKKQRELLKYSAELMLATLKQRLEEITK